MTRAPAKCPAAVQQGCPFCRPEVDPSALNRAVRQLLSYTCLDCGASWTRKRRAWTRPADAAPVVGSTP